MKKWDVVDSKKSGLKSIPQEDLDESSDGSSDGEETILSDEDQDNLIL